MIHYEGRTSGTDTASGVKAHQVANAAKLFLRWRDRLAHHRPNGEAPYLERDRAVRQRALIVDATTPTPKQDAGSVTTTQTLQLFAELGYKPYYMPQDNFLFEPEHTPALQAMGVECLYAPYEGPFDACIRRYGALFDVIFVYRFPVLEQTLDLLRRFAPQAPVLFHAMDLHFLRLEREAELDGSDATRAAAAQARTRELELIRRVDCAITHSTFERDLLAAEAPETPIVVWPFMFEFLGNEHRLRCPPRLRLPRRLPAPPECGRGAVLRRRGAAADPCRDPGGALHHRRRQSRAGGAGSLPARTSSSPA